MASVGPDVLTKPDLSPPAKKIVRSRRNSWVLWELYRRLRSRAYQSVKTAMDEADTTELSAH
jgi:hypothetical protein